MNRGPLFPVLALVVAIAASQTIFPTTTSQSVSKPSDPAVAIPFELVTRHIVLKIQVNNSRPLSFVLDTGDKFAIIDLGRAKELGLKLEGEVRMGGAGAGTSVGSHVRDSSFTVPGLPGFSQPVTLALPIAGMASKFGQDFDGIIGADFIKQFVVEVDYQARLIKLHDKDKFTYSGSGESIPIKLDRHDHPIIEAEVTPVGGQPSREKFVVDLGSGGGLALHSPFVARRNLLGPNLNTIKLIGAGGAGGQVSGRLGRVSGLKIGSFTIKNPIAMFSEDKAGAFATTALAGNIGAKIMSKFRVFLDYNRERMILEPNSTYAQPIDRAQSGLSLSALGTDYRTFRVNDVLENSPATEAGLEASDIITAIDGRSAAEFTLTRINDMFERPGTYKLSIKRGEKTVTVNLKTRKLV